MFIVSAFYSLSYTCLTKEFACFYVFFDEMFQLTKGIDEREALPGILPRIKLIEMTFSWKK